MPDQSLTARERAVLFVLMAEATEVSNPELRERVGYVLDGAPRRRLNEFKLVESRKVGRPFVHELTDDGWAWCRAAIAEPIALDTDINGRTLHAVLAGVQRFLDRSNQKLSDVFQPGPPAASLTNPAPAAVEPIDVDARIRAAYGQLSPGPGAGVSLARLRKHLEDVVHTDLDAALRRLNRTPGVTITADPDQRTLTAEDKAAALHIGGEDKHLLMIESS